MAMILANTEVIMIKILGLILAILVTGAGLAALPATVELLFPDVVGRCRTALEKSLLRLFLLGLVNFVFFVVLAILLGKVSEAVPHHFKAVFGLPAVLILAALVVLAAPGLTGLVTLLRTRMGSTSSPVIGALRAAVLLFLAGLTPVVGWWLFTPLVLITSLGAGIAAVVRRPAKRAAAPVPTPPA
jgi:hypothetical protein